MAYLSLVELFIQCKLFLRRGKDVSEAQQLQQLKEKLALASRILYMEGHGDFYLGHVSVRLPNQEHYLMKPSGLGLEEVGHDDIVTVDLDGNRIAGERSVHNEHPIHGEIYRRRPDVQSVIHTHPPYATALAAAPNRRLKMVNHDCIPFARGIGFLPNPVLLITQEQGRQLAEALGSYNAVLLQNHGIVAVGTSLEEAVFHAISLEKAARAQTITENLCGDAEIEPDLALEMLEHFESMNPKRLRVIWNYLVRKLERSNA